MIGELRLQQWYQAQLRDMDSVEGKGLSKATIKNWKEAHVNNLEEQVPDLAKELGISDDRMKHLIADLRRSI